MSRSRRQQNMSPPDWPKIRAEFPALDGRAFLNTATFGQMPRRAVDAVGRHWQRRDELACTDFIDWYDDADRLRRAIASLIHCSADDIAFIPNAAIAPFTVVVTPVNFADRGQHAAAVEIYQACKAAGLDVVLDDRDERPGVKFKDADLIGIPCRVTVGKKLAQGKVEVVDRKTRASEDVAVEEAAAAVARHVR